MSRRHPEGPRRRELRRWELRSEGSDGLVDVPDPDIRVPIAFMEVRCNRCDHRVDVISLVRPDLDTEAGLRSRYADGFRVIVGEPPRWAGQAHYDYGCRQCGRSDLRLAKERVSEYFNPINDEVPLGSAPERVRRAVVRV